MSSPSVPKNVSCPRVNGIRLVDKMPGERVRVLATVEKVQGTTLVAETYDTVKLTLDCTTDALEGIALHNVVEVVMTCGKDVGTGSAEEVTKLSETRDAINLKLYADIADIVAGERMDPNIAMMV